MNCQSIDGLTLGSDSIRAVEEIRKKQSLANYMSSLLSGGVLANILITNQSLVMPFNIYQTDFQMYAKAMNAVPFILKNEIEKIASYQLLRNLDHKQRTFWKGIYYGCN